MVALAGGWPNEIYGPPPAASRRPPGCPPAACPFSAGAAAGPQCPHKVFICLYSVSASALGETGSGKPRPGELFLGRDTPSAAPGCRRPAGGRRLPTAVASGPRTAAEDRRAHRRAHRRDWRRKRQTRRDEGLIACGTDTRPGTVTPPNPVQSRQPSSIARKGGAMSTHTLRNFSFPAAGAFQCALHGTAPHLAAFAARPAVRSGQLSASATWSASARARPASAFSYASAAAVHAEIMSPS